jgi:prepilin-type processing-associated H-X9-DG protein
MFLSKTHGYPSGFRSTNSDEPGWWALQLERGGLGIKAPETNFFRQGIWLCPSARGVLGEAFKSYGNNGFGVLPTFSIFTNTLGLSGYWTGSEFTPVNESEVVMPADMMAIGEGNGGAFFMRVDLAKWEDDSNILTRHQGKANICFCDGHVESPTLHFLFEDTSDEALSRWNRDHQPHREKLAP